VGLTNVPPLQGGIKTQLLSQAFSLGCHITGFQPILFYGSLWLFLKIKPSISPMFSTFSPKHAKNFKKGIALKHDFDKLRTPRRPQGRQDSMFADR
jgi:hypothetical protein